MGKCKFRRKYSENARGLRKLSNWSKENRMPFNGSKCKVIHIGKKNPRGVYTKWSKCDRRKGRKGLRDYGNKYILTFVKL